ncbi:MAG: hypothetical protein ABSG68_11835 [Thermoguttaceae bacterium]|jgi:hypothetical protein
MESEQSQTEGPWSYARQQIKELQNAKEQACVICMAAEQLFKAVEDDDSLLAPMGIAGLLGPQNLNGLEESLQAVGFLIDPVRIRVTVPGIPPTTTRSAWGTLKSYSAHQAAWVLGHALSRFLTEKLSQLPPDRDMAADSAVAAHELVKGHWTTLRRNLADVSQFDVEAVIDALCRESQAAMENCNAKQASGGAEAVPDDSAWVRSSPSIWSEHFRNNKELTGFRADHADMFRNRSKNRLEIHAGKWAAYWAARAKAGFETLDGDLQSVADDPDVQDEALVEAMQRMAEVRARKQAKK